MTSDVKQYFAERRKRVKVNPEHDFHIGIVERILVLLMKFLNAIIRSTTRLVKKLSK